MTGHYFSEHPFFKCFGCYVSPEDIKRRRAGTLFISPPFGNYVHFLGTLSIKGSYTYEPRPGLFGQIVKTLRYSFKDKGWINKIGLRNKGIDYAIDNYNSKKDIISIAILKEDEIDNFLEKIPGDMNLELNISCPNLDKNPISENIHKFLNEKRSWCIVKLSPLTEMSLVDKFYNDGFRQFHCSNTLPVEKGGLSGPSLIPYTCKIIRQIKEKYPDTEIIGGGGIRNYKTLELYRSNGAVHFSISTLLFSPLKFGLFFWDFIRNNKSK